MLLLLASLLPLCCISLAYLLVLVLYVEARESPTSSLETIVRSDASRGSLIDSFQKTFWLIQSWNKILESDASDFYNPRAHNWATYSRNP